ncbi:hypothetical protein [Novosphingobium resinovorum]|uniref:TolB family protein n=1 Tax=Novosphingobium resinovorum TaxID=158500 RepID=UPI002ED0703D|nr:hypothetical protein [Novosphingobium resinovorum]
MKNRRYISTIRLSLARGSRLRAEALQSTASSRHSISYSLEFSFLLRQDWLALRIAFAVDEPMADSPTPHVNAGPFRTLRKGQVSEVRFLEIGAAHHITIGCFDRLVEAPNWLPEREQLIVNGSGALHRLCLDDDTQLDEIACAGITDVNNDHVLSPDGNDIYISAAGCIYALPLEGGIPRRISPESHLAFYLHGVSPDGSTLACTTKNVRDPHASWGLHTFLAAGGPASALIVSDIPVDGPEWTPDGEWIWFNAEIEADRPGHARLFRIRPDGSQRERMTHGDRVDWFPHPSPDGQWIAYLSYPPETLGHPADMPVEIRLIPASGGEPVTLASFNGGQGSLNVNSWAADSRRFAYVAYPDADLSSAKAQTR